MLQEFAVPGLQARMDIASVIFQQDGAPPHFARSVRDFLNTTFPDGWIGRRGPLPWAPRSPDLTPCDFFLWGYVKSKVFSTNCFDLAQLEERIRSTLSEIPEEMLRNVGEACVRQWMEVIENEGAHVEVTL